MTIEMPVVVLHDFNILKKSRLSKRQQKIKANKLKPIPYQYLIPLIFPNITESSDTLCTACESSRLVILDGNTPGN